MAVIQDLPLELIWRIFELGSEPPTDLSPRTLLDFRQLSLVARDWREPAQRLLHFTTSRLTTRWQHNIQSSTRDNSRAISSATLVHGLANPNRAVELLQFLRDEGVKVSALDLTGIGSIPAELIDPHLLGGLKTLRLGLRLTGELKTPPGVVPDLRIATLFLGSTFSSPAISPFLLGAAHLTRLELLLGRQDLPSTSSELWLALAPRIRHLSLFQIPVAVAALPTTARLAPVPELATFLRAATSLVSLHLSGGPMAVTSVIALVPTQLVLLHTKLLLEFTCDGDPAALFGVFKLPAMAKARRWRTVNQLHCLKIASGLDWEEQWASACRARGIEPRGEERYYTD